MALDDHDMHRLGLAFIYRMIPVIVMSILYGIYIAILCAATRGLSQKRLKYPANAMILLVLYAVFLLTTSLWALELAQLIGLDEFLLSPNGLDSDTLFNHFYELVARETRATGILFEVQMILGDILVIWRASAIWHDRRVVILVPLFWWASLIINTIIQAEFCHSGVATTNYSHLCKVTNVLAPVLSIMTNLSVMVLTLLKVWSLRVVLLESLRKQRNDKILSLFVLLIESGTLYVAMLVTDLLVTSYVTGGNETLGRMIDCISGYATVQFVGIYPTLMIVMLRQSVWNISDDVHSTNGGLSIDRMSVLSTVNFAVRSERATLYDSDSERATHVKIKNLPINPAKSSKEALGGMSTRRTSLSDAPSAQYVAFQVYDK